MPPPILEGKGGEGKREWEREREIDRERERERDVPEENLLGAITEILVEITTVDYLATLDIKEED